jgi:phospholipase/lecithinase/hemolysin
MRAIIAAVLLSVLVVAAPASGQTYDRFYTFGDSLVDNGNVLAATLQTGTPLPPPGAYCQGRFSNGPVAFEFAWALLQGLPLDPACPVPPVPGGLQPILFGGAGPAVNFAFGGASTGLFNPAPGGMTVPGLKGQVAFFQLALGGRPPSPQALYAILAGANDYLSLTRIKPSQEERIVEGVVGNIADSIRQLHRLGARAVIVVNLPDLGLSPLSAPDPVRRVALSRLAAQHNRQLAAALARLQNKLDGLRIVPIDLAAPLAALPALGFDVQTPAMDRLLPPPPELGGLPMSFCIFVDPQACGVVSDFNAVPPSLFWDAEHPTTQAHYVLAQYILFRLQTP